MKKIINVDQYLNNNSNLCIKILTKYIINNKITSTTVSTAAGEINILGENWQIQIRLEKNDFYKENEIVESMVFVKKDKL